MVALQGPQGPKGQKGITKGLWKVCYIHKENTFIKEYMDVTMVFTSDC